MSTLSENIQDIQRTAADMPDDILKDEIRLHLVDAGEAITRLYNIRHNTVPDADYVDAVGDFMTSALVITLYVRELTSRPPRAAWLIISAN